jgi:hypothetical protein
MFSRRRSSAQHRLEALALPPATAVKSFVMVLLGVYPATFRDYRQLAEKATVMIVAVDRKQARVVLRAARLSRPVEVSLSKRARDGLRCIQMWTPSCWLCAMSSSRK